MILLGREPADRHDQIGVALASGAVTSEGSITALADMRVSFSSGTRKVLHEIASRAFGQRHHDVGETIGKTQNPVRGAVLP